MDENPLIPKSSNVASIDVAPVIGAVFQDATEPTFKKNVAHNVDKYVVENQNLKASSAKVICAFNDAKLSMEDIDLVENSLMVRQGASMNEKYYLDQDHIVCEHLKLKRKELLMDLGQPEVNKYGLLQKNDFLPIKPERSMDFRINSNQHLCEICPSDTQNRLDPLDSKRGDRIRQSKISLIPIRLPNMPMKKVVTGEIFRAEPNELLFSNYELDVTYEKMFKLRNVSRTNQSFLPSLLPKTSVFKVALHPNSNSRLAPGMCAIFTVTFKIDIFENHEETITFRSQSASLTTVNLICFCKPPSLKIYVYKDLCRFVEKMDAMSISNFKMERNLALNSTIDCGSCFIGNIQTITLVLHNEGCTGKFFLVTEEDWYGDTIQSISTEMMVELPHFTIFPSFFRVQEGHFTEVIINFFPSSFGLEVEKLFLLCNNNALQDIEIIGDGVMFDRNTVVLETDFSSNQIREHNDNLLCEVVENIEVSPLPYTLKFDDCLPHVSKTRHIIVHNNSTVDLYYKWVIKYPKRNKQHPKIKRMNSNMISIGDVADYLPGNSTTKFPVTILSKNHKLGFFGLVLILYVLDIPENALTEGVRFWVTEESRSSSNLEMDNDAKVSRLNLIVAEVELLCKMVELEVRFDPPNWITAVHPPYVDCRWNQMHEQTINILITSNWNVPLECAWKPPKKYSVSIKPLMFTLKPNTPASCYLTVHMKKAKTIRATLKLMINGGSHKKSFHVKVKVSKGMATFLKGTLNFGYIDKDKDVIRKEFFIKNTGHEKLQWEIFEFYYNARRKRIYEVESFVHLSASKGTLAQQEQFAITYSVNPKLEQRNWVSYLILISTVPKSIALDTCVVMYQLGESDLMIRTVSYEYEYPILSPKHILYLNVPEKFEVTLYNTSEDVPGAFIWGIPVGSQSTKMIVKCNPRSGFVSCCKSVLIKLTITPLETGIIDDFVLPCFAGNRNDPLLLTVMCAVDNIHVNFFLPVSNRFLKVCWPPGIVSALTGLTVEVEAENETEECGNSPGEENLSNIDCGYSSLLCPSMESIVKYTTEGMRGCEEEGFDSVVDDWNKLISFKESKSLTLPELPFQSLKNAFGTEVFLHDYVIEFRQVPLKTPVKKSIIAENITPINGHFFVECSTFYGNDECEDENTSTNILYKLNITRKDTWEDIIDGELGLVVKVSPLNGVFKEHSVLEIDIWVYANTWGTYMEEVKIDIDDIQPFCFNILVEVVGIPIEFPIACNSIRSSPVLRFGSIPYLSDPITRKLTIKNTSNIPISLGWHVFLCKPKSPRKKGSPKEPFNVVLDTFEEPTSPYSNKSHETDFKLLVTPVNYGREDDEIFQILPRDLRLEPKSSAVLDVVVNPKLFQPQFDKTFIEARLIGHLHLSDKHSFQSNLFKRLSGTDIPPAKIKLLATIEMPLLKLELVKGETRIRAYANDIIEAQQMVYERVLVFKNYDTAPIMVYMHTTNPFQVIYLHTKANPKKKLKAAEILPQECVEVLVRCTIDDEAVLHYSNMLFNEKESIFTEVPNFSQQSITLVRSLNIHQYGLQKQITNLEMILFYPKLVISNEFIDFGVVFVGGTKKSLLTLTNPTGSHVPFTIQSNTEKFLTIIPNNGIVPKAIGITPSSIIISLYFIPKECRVFQETLRVVTNMPFYNFQVNIMGTGSNNEKFLTEGI